MKTKRLSLAAMLMIHQKDKRKPHCPQCSQPKALEDFYNDTGYESAENSVRCNDCYSLLVTEQCDQFVSIQKAEPSITLIDPIQPNNVIAESYGIKYFSGYHYHKEYGKLSFCGLCGNSGRIDTRGRAITGAGLDVGIYTYCLCANGQAERASDPKEKEKEKEIQKKYDKCDSWWCGFSIPTHKEIIDGEEHEVSYTPDEVPFDFWITGWGSGYSTCVARIMAEDARTVEEVYALIEKHFTIHEWRWVPRPDDSSEHVEERFSTTERTT